MPCRNTLHLHSRFKRLQVVADQVPRGWIRVEVEANAASWCVAHRGGGSRRGVTPGDVTLQIIHKKVLGGGGRLREVGNRSGSELAQYTGTTKNTHKQAVAYRDTAHTQNTWARLQVSRIVALLEAGDVRDRVGYGVCSGLRGYLRECVYKRERARACVCE